MTHDPKTFAHVDVNLGFGPEGTRRSGSDGTPLSVALLGDFSGRAGRGVHDVALADRKAHRVDPDTLSELPARLRPRLTITRDGRQTVEIELQSPDDLSPDGLVRRVEPLRELRRLRRRLDDPATAEHAAAEIRRIAGAPPPAVTASTPPEERRDAAQDLVAELLAGPEPAASRPDELGVGAFVQEIVGRHVLPSPRPDLDALSAQVNAALSDEVRSLLRSPALRGVEIAWRGLQLVADRVSLGDRVLLDVIDVTKAELAADLAGARETGASGLAKRMARGGGAHGDEPYGLIVGLFGVEATPEDAALVARLSLLAQALGATVLLDGDTRLAGCANVARRPDSDDWDGDLPADAAQAWAACQMLPSARHVGLAAPRVLARAPFGERTTPAETFAFEEIEGGLSHDDLSWGSAAAACAAALMAGYADERRPFDPAACREIGELPLFVHESGGERQQVPCAEAWLTERSARVLVEAGLIPMLSVRGSNAVRVGTWRSLAQPPAPLAGRLFG